MRASGGEDEELDFRLMFGEELENPQSVPGCSDLEADDSPAYAEAPSFTVNQPIGIPRHGAPSRAGMHSPPPRPAADADYGGTYESQPARLIHLGGCTVLACPSIQITSISPGTGGQEMEPADEEGGPDFWGGRDHLYLPLDPFGYRDSSLSPSPASSFSSPRGWPSDTSSCGSGSHLSDDVEPELSEAALRCALGCPADEAWPSPGSPCPSPGDECRFSPRQPASGPPSRPSSPCGKRRHSGCEAYYYRHRHSPSPSPGPSRRGSVTSSSSSSSSPLLPASAVVEDVPHKARRTSQEQNVALYRQAQEGEGEAVSPYLGQEAEEGPAAYQMAKKDATPMEYLTVPSPFVWTKARVGGHSPVFRASALPPLDWPLPSHYEHLGLKVEVQPKTHHRAHYETEGSRGAVKATAGGHPVVKLQGYLEKPLTLQMFIGTADDRNLRPHAFYQVHRITGKMVATSSQEAVVSTTKVLEVSLLPENNMTTSIDCAGILKLRNSDIELRKGETDIGRKNTRVKLVFRVHVPQPNGKVVSLQVASVPIECSQRSAHELPQVESYNVNSSPVTGGEELLLTGCNFLPESKVVFIEKGPDGRPQWEVDAKIDNVRSTETLIVAEVPPYRNQSLTRAAQVCFLVCNGKRKRSPCQCFQYLPVLVKEEPYEGFEVGPDSPLRSPLEYPPSVPTAGLCQPPSALSDPGVFAPASPSVPLPPNPGCPAPKAFGDSCPHPSPVPGLPAFLLDAEWNEACKLVPPGFGCSLTPPNQGHPLTPPNQGHPLTPSNQGHPLTPPNQGHPLTPPNQGHPLTPPNHGHPLTPPNQGHPLTPPNQGHPLTPSNHGHPLTPSNHGHPLTPPNQGHPSTQSNHGHPLIPSKHGHPLTPPNQGHPLTPTNQGQPLTPPSHGHPLTPLNHGHTLTPPNQGHPLTPLNQGHPLTPPNQGHPLTPLNHGQPLTPPNQGHPLTPLNHGHPLMHLPLGPSCSYGPPDWASGADLHLPAPPVGPFYPTPSQALGHPSPPAQSPGNGLSPPPPSAPRPQRASYPPEPPPAARANPSCRLAQHGPAFPSGSVPSSPDSGAFQDAGRMAAAGGTAGPPPDSSPSRQRRPFLEQPPPPPARGQDEGGGGARAPPETPAADAKGETMECDLTFSTIPIQGITLDDVNEIIGRDLTQVPESLRADGAAENP